MDGYEINGSNLRLQTQHIRDALALIPLGIADLADGVDEAHARHPLVGGQLDVAGEVVQVADERREDLALAGAGLGPDGVNDMLGEVGVEAGGLVGAHCEGCG
jgi:hypothetical protein